jgi:hypothetical protein
MGEFHFVALVLHLGKKWKRDFAYGFHWTCFNRRPHHCEFNHQMFLFTSFVFCRCVSKKKSFAPGTMYKPFGKEAAGTMTLSQFQTLHEKDQETASLRELGLNETEILIWKSHVSGEKVNRLFS